MSETSSSSAEQNERVLPGSRSDSESGDSDNSRDSTILSSRYQVSTTQQLKQSITNSLEQSVVNNRTSRILGASSVMQSHGMSLQETYGVLTSLEKQGVKLLKQDIDVQRAMLMQGKDVKRVRQEILEHLYAISQTFTKFKNFFEEDYEVRKQILKNFKAWDRDKQEMEKEIGRINQEMTHDAKLQDLEEQHNKVSGEIEKLEQELRRLKKRKRQIKDDIVETRSVMESEKSRFMRQRHNIDKMETNAIDKLLRSKYLLPQDLGQLPLSQHNVVDNLRNVFRTGHVDVQSAKELLHMQQEKAKLSKKYYRGCVEDFNKIVMLWSEVAARLNENEAELFKFLNENSDMALRKEKLKDTLVCNVEYLEQSLQQLRGQENVSEIFRAVLQNELDVNLQGLKSVDPSYEHNTVPDIKTSPVYDRSTFFDRPMTPLMRIRSVSSSPPATSYVNTYGEIKRD